MRWSTASRATTATPSRRSSDPTTASTSRPRRVDPEDVTNFLEAWAQGALDRAGRRRQGVSRRREERLDTADPDREDGRRLAVSTPRRAPDEMRIRRIGRNELAAIQVALAYTDAQEEYHGARLERRRRLRVRDARVVVAGQARRPVLGVAAGRAGESARRRVRGREGRASRITGTCTRSSPRRARMRPAARAATSRTAT